LLWISVFCTIYFVGTQFPIKTILLNISGLFGVFEIDKYIATGSWSIGNELVFYLVFPVFILGSKRFNWFLEFFFILTLIIAGLFAFNFLESTSSLSEQWKIYINPLNQLFLFVGGALLGKYFKLLRNNYFSAIALIISILSLFFLIGEGDLINIVSGVNRFLFSSIGFLVTFSFLVGKIKFNNTVKVILSNLGHISYSLYLIHPIVFWVLAKSLNRVENPYQFIFIGYGITILLSLVVYYFIETRFMKIGKRVAVKMGNSSQSL